jgi:hypothetical protein
MRFKGKYQYICNNCGNEWYSKKKIKTIKNKQNLKKQDPVKFDIKEHIIKKPDGTIKTVELEVIEMK